MRYPGSKSASAVGAVLRGVSLVVAGILLVSRAVAQEPDRRALLAGDWRYDPLRSEELSDKLRGGGGGLPGGIGPRPGGVGGGTGGGGRAGRGPAGGYRGLMEPSRMMELLRPPQQLSVSIADTAVSIRADLGVPRPLYLDGRSTVDTLGDLTVRSSTAKWSKDRLEVVRKVKDGGRVRETWWYDAASESLVVDVKVDDVPRKIEVRRVYLRAKS